MGSVVPSMGNPSTSYLKNPEINCQKCPRITCYVVGIILLIAGVLAVAKVNPFNSIGNTWGGIMIGCGVLLMLIPYIVNRCSSQSTGQVASLSHKPTAKAQLKAKEIPIPTFDELVARDAALATLIGQSNVVTLTIESDISSQSFFQRNGSASLERYENLTLDGCRSAINNVRDLYAERAKWWDLKYYVRMTFEKPPHQNRHFKWGVPHNQ